MTNIKETYIDRDAERHVLSAMMQDRSGRVCVTVLQALTEADFSEKFYRELYTLCSDLFARGTKPLYMEILSEGSKIGWLDTGQDMENLRYVNEHYTDEDNAPYWIDRVKQASKGRAIYSLIHKVGAMVKDEKPPDEILELANSGFFRIATDTGDERGMSPQALADLGCSLIDERVAKYRQAMEEAKLAGLDVPPFVLEGLPTGFPTLDATTYGYKGGELIILSAETGQGKTAFALQTAEAIAIRNKEPLAYINTEMKNDQLAYRWGGILSGLPVGLLRSGALTDAQRAQAREAYGLLRKSGFYPYYAPDLTISKLQLTAKQYKMQYDVKMIIVDYIGRMDKLSSDMTEWQMLERIVKQCKLLAQDLDIPVMVLAQLNADGTMQGTKRMRNEADLVMQLQPIKTPDEIAEIEQKKGTFYEKFNYRLYIDKARDAAGGGNIPIVFDKDKQSMREAVDLSKKVKEE